MRIDFAGRYKEVADLLKASTKAPNQTSDAAFEENLGSLILQPSDTSGLNTEKSAQQLDGYAPKQSLPNPIDDIRASLNLSDPGLKMSSLTPLVPKQEVSELPTPATPQVKTPTVLEVKRVELPPKGDISPVAQLDFVPQLDKEAIRTKLVSAASKAGLDPSLTQAVVHAESSFNVKAVSSDGHASKGLFQLLDSTGHTLMSRSEGGVDKYDPFNPDLNIHLGTSYLRYLHDIFKTKTDLQNKLSTYPAADNQSLEKFALAAFNAGEGRVASAQGRSERLGKDPTLYDQVAPFLPKTTREYVAKVVDGKRRF